MGPSEPRPRPPAIAGGPLQPAAPTPAAPATTGIELPTPPSLWRHREFLKLWTGRTVSGFGSQVSRLAIPLTAVEVLDATPAQMGLLQAAGTAPALVLGLMAGVWVDRYRRRPLLVAADLGRALLLGAIPLLSLMGMLRIEALIAVALLTGILTLFFDVASTSFVPSFLSRTQLVDGNSKLTASTSVAAVAGPSLGGTLVQLLSAPIAVAADAFSFLVSAVCHALLRVDEPAPRPQGAEPGAGQGSSGARGGIWGQLWAELLEGLGVVGANGYLRACAGTAGVFNFFAGIFFTVYVLYATRELGVSAAALGLLYAGGGVGSVLGAVVAAPLAQRAGFGVATVGAACLVGVGWVPAALVAPGAPLVLPILAGAHFLRGLSQTVYGINSVSLRQAAVPDQLQGRVAGTLRVIFLGTVPLGSLAGGLLGERLGLWPTLALGASGALLGALWMLLSPVRALRALPTAEDEHLLADV
jgi:Transmembrane secretion effector